ncbi:hypothetical protein [Azospirillum picis]|uniref:Uncharacterized protein n=1 Tax=Azospirillum picis TaxID=488438 RepID=A0ABU0MTL9_9PROT|nr:hypothetical protein [Azospirillum picis]MBP2302710.1 hypothetical protein [Azospirillum picis]MDQ0536461.1 hypothetical protein [Azospirillum picis]
MPPTLLIPRTPLPVALSRAVDWDSVPDNPANCPLSCPVVSLIIAKTNWSGATAGGNAATHRFKTTPHDKVLE